MQPQEQRRSQASQAPPNILLVMADQLSALATSPYGNRDVLTPHLQALSDRGTVFERSYCNAPLCAPSRASMLTGLLSSRLPVNDNAEELPATAVTFVHYLRRAGYRTVLSGKMHYVGPDQLHGFEERLTTDIYPADYLWTKTWDSQGDPPRRVGLPGDAETGPSYVRQMAQMVKEAGPVPWSYQHDYDEETHHRALGELRTLARRRGAEVARPWFLCVSYTHPHDPYVNLPRYWDRYEGREIAPPPAPPADWHPHPIDVWTNAYHGVDAVAPTAEDVARARRGYYASTSYFDDKLGSLLGELERLGLGANTVVLVTADHGDMCGERGMWFKRTVREWAARVPLVAAGPGVAAGQRAGEVVSLVDLFPTVLDLAGLALQGEFPHPLDGHSLVPLLRAERPPGWPDEAIVENLGEATISPIRALVRGRHKLIYTHGQPDQLHDLRVDPLEWTNLAGPAGAPADAALAASLKARLLDGWDPAQADREVRQSQHRRAFLKEALFTGRYAPWDYQPPGRGAEEYVRRGSNRQWDPDLGV
ncbi:MAG TPA: choline-sulfatase [Chloroflexota bacterium]|nr:choline-sulfatase [Chloroflexota bacterium]